MSGRHSCDRRRSPAHSGDMGSNSKSGSSSRSASPRSPPSRSASGNSGRHRSRSRSVSGDERFYRKSSKHSRSRSRSHSRRRSRSRSNGRGRRYPSYGEPKPNRCLGVFGLSLYTTERQIRDIFSKYGPLKDVQVIYDAKTGKSRGFCFVYYESESDAKLAREQCTGMEIDGRRIRVDFSITQRAHTPTPGIYMGNPTYSRDDRRRGRYDDEYGGYRGYRRSPSPHRPRRKSYRSRYYERSRSRSYSPRRY